MDVDGNGDVAEAEVGLIIIAVVRSLARSWLPEGASERTNGEIERRVCHYH